MVADITKTRLVGGPDAGCLRVTVSLTLSGEHELALARRMGREEYERVLGILKAPIRKRGLSPVAALVANAMVWAVEDLKNRKEVVGG